MIVRFEQTTHHTGHVTGEVITRLFGDGRWGGGDRIIRVIKYGSLLCGFAAFRAIGGSAWARLNRGFGLAATRGGDWTHGGDGALGRCRGGRRGPIVVTGAAVGSIARSRELRDSRTGEVIGSVGEGVDEDTGVIVRVSTGEFDKFIGAGGSGLVTANIELHTCGVELGTAGLVSQMQGNDLVAKKISTGGQVGREGERVSLSVNCTGPISIMNQKRELSDSIH